MIIYYKNAGYIFKRYFWIVLMAMALVFNAVAYADSDEQLELKINGALSDLKANAETDKKIAQSNQLQIDSTEMAKKEDNKIHNEFVQLQMRASDADRMRENLINSGCPENGGKVPAEVADRCNPLIREHRAIVEKIESDLNNLKWRKEKVNEIWKNISATTLKNAEEKNKNDAQRKELESKLRQLRTQRINLAVSRMGAMKKAEAVNNCKRIQKLEEASCCISVVMDGANPSRCNVELICQVFEHGGFFGSSVVKPVR